MSIYIYFLILNYAAPIYIFPRLKIRCPIWFTQLSSTHPDKIEVVQNKALMIATSSIKCRGVPPQSQDSGPPLEVTPRTVCPAVLR